MSYLVPAIAAAAVSVGVLGGAFVMLRKKLGGSSAAERAGFLTEITSLTTELEGLRQYEKSYTGVGQLTSLKERLEKIQIELSTQTDALKIVEARLNDAQKIVEGKEAHHQEIKSVRVADEVALQGILARYNDISEESISLEKSLAASMKNLDAMLNELTLTEEQRKLLTELSTALSNAGERLRDLLTEYNTVKERLDSLTEQHAALEEEYTKLVEQQLGE